MKRIITKLLFFLLAFNIISCSKVDETPPNINGGGSVQSGITVTTIDATNIKTILATANCKVVVDPTLNSISQKGVIWSITQNPTTNLTTKTTDGNSTGDYQSQITNLQSNTKYYVRAYATDKKGITTYGNEITFNTKVGWKSIFVGEMSYVIGLKADGTLWAWGSNNLGQLGIGGNNQKNIPVQIGSENDWKQVSIGGATELINDHQGAYVLAIKNDGSLWAWGNNSHGQLGTGNKLNSATPIRVGNSNDWKQTCASINTSSAIKNDGSIWQWGKSNVEFQSLQSNTPVIFTGINQINTFAIGVSDLTHLAAKKDGSIWAWGLNQAGQIGNGGTNVINNPIQIAKSLSFSSIYKSSFNSFGITASGQLYGWGYNAFGQLGDGTNENKSAPTLINTMNSCKLLSNSPNTTFAIKLDGTMWATGSSNNGSFGNGIDLNQFYSFTKISNDNDWNSVFSASGYTFAIKNNGSLWVAGDNRFGQLGLGTPINYISNIFVLVD